MLNKVMIIGRLGRDPELRYTQNGTPVTSLNIATDESYIDREGVRQERTEWHRVTVFQKQAENCSNYLSKGSLVFVEGSLQTRKWQDQQGQDRYTTEIKAQRVQFLERRSFNEGGPRNEEGGYTSAPRGGNNAPRGNWNQQYNGNGAPHNHERPAPAQAQTQAPRQQQNFAGGKEEDLGSPFPSEASMDEVPF